MAKDGVTSAYQRIRQAIVEGAYRPGQRLIEQRIAEEFDLSRTPVREALRLLQAEGLVQVEPNRGAIVRRLAVEDIVDLYELRARLEAYAAERAAVRLTASELEHLDEALDHFDAAAARAASGDLDALREVGRWNSEIHGAIVTASRHERLATMLARTVDHPLVFQSFRQFDAEQMARSALFHRLIRDALVAGDAPRAGALMAEHVYQGRDVLLAAVEALVSVDALFDDADGAPAHLTPPPARRGEATPRR